MRLCARRRCVHSHCDACAHDNITHRPPDVDTLRSLEHWRPMSSTDASTAPTGVTLTGDECAQVVRCIADYCKANAYVMCMFARMMCMRVCSLPLGARLPSQSAPVDDDSATQTVADSSTHLATEATQPVALTLTVSPTVLPVTESAAIAPVQAAHVSVAASVASSSPVVTTSASNAPQQFARWLRFFNAARRETSEQ
jgi:hypothetical protein